MSRSLLKQSFYLNLKAQYVLNNVAALNFRFIQRSQLLDTMTGTCATKQSPSGSSRRLGNERQLSVGSSFVIMSFAFELKFVARYCDQSYL